MLIEIGKYKHDLSDIVRGFFYCYRKFGLIRSDHASSATYAEIKYFRDLGDMLNFATEVEARTSSKDKKPADLVWVEEYDGEYYSPKKLVLHLERETRGWDKSNVIKNNLFPRSTVHKVPIGIAIIDNVPKTKHDKIVNIFEKAYYSKKRFDEFALIIYTKYRKNQKNIFAKIFYKNYKPEIIQAKFEYVGKQEKEAAEFVIVSD